MRSFIAILTVALFVSSLSSNCSKGKEVVYEKDTLVLTTRDTTVITVNSQIDLKKDLILYYPFNNSVNDASGNNRHGTVHGTLQFTADKNNRHHGAAQFDGATTFITLADTRSFSSTAITISMFIYRANPLEHALAYRHDYTNGTNTIWGARICGLHEWYHQSVVFGTYRPNASACNAFDAANSWDTVRTSREVHPLEWHHVAFVFDNGIQKLYLNGKQHAAATKDYNVTKDCADAALVIGARRASAPAYFQGKMDEFRIYNRALNQLEIMELAKGE